MAKLLKLIMKENLEEDTILGTETADEKAAKADAKSKGLYSESSDTFTQEDADNYLPAIMQAIVKSKNEAKGLSLEVPKAGTLMNNNSVISYDIGILRNTGVDLVGLSDYIKYNLIDIINDGSIEVSVVPDSQNIQIHLYKKDLVESVKKDLKEDEDNDSVDEVVDDIQDETPTEDEEDNSTLDSQLDDLRDVLPDLDLNLYQVTSKENPNSNFYFIGKVADDSNKVLMLVDNKPVEDDENSENLPIEVEDEEVNLEPVDSDGDTPEENEEDDRFDFVIVPSKFDDFTKLNPRYGEGMNPDHEAIMEYLMKCLVEVNPERAEELAQDDKEDTDIIVDEISDDEDKI